MGVMGGAKPASGFGALGMLARAYFVTSARHDAQTLKLLRRSLARVQDPPDPYARTPPISSIPRVGRLITSA